jgi:hypothetical protein
MRTLAVFFLCFFPSLLQASSGDAKVLTMLRANPIVQAAVAEAKKFSGASDCDYQVESTELTQFAPGSTFDYSAEITCSNPNENEEGAGLVQVRGQTSGEGPEELSLKVSFVG